MVDIDLYTGAKFSESPILLPTPGIFENIAYCCIDKSIYGLTRQNYITSVYDSVNMMHVDVIDSTTFRLSKINPNTGAVTFISPYHIGAGGNLTGGSFIDPDAMTYFFSNGNKIAGVSLVTGLLKSNVPKSFELDAFAFDMMRSTQNCFAAQALRMNNSTGIEVISNSKTEMILYPNPAQKEITLKINTSFNHIEIFDSRGHLILVSKQKTIDVSRLSSGIYFAKVVAKNGSFFTGKFVKY